MMIWNSLSLINKSVFPGLAELNKFELGACKHVSRNFIEIQLHFKVTYSISKCGLKN